MTDPTPEAVRERKLRQIQTMLDLASDERTPEGEREAAMNRAMALMAAYGVDEMMLNARRGQHTDPVIRHRIPMSDPYSYEKMHLAHEIASALNCKTTYQHLGRRVTSITLFGFKSDVERVELLYTSLLLQAVNGVRNERPAWYASAAETRSYRKNWLVGFANRVGTRLWLKEKEAREAHDQAHRNDASGEPGTALVLSTRAQKVKAFYEEETTDIKFGRKSRRSYGEEGYGDGSRAGSKADLGGTGVTTGERPALPA
jgi:hypothetical protein